MMSFRHLAASMTLAGGLLPAIALADDVAALRAELEALKGEYAVRIATLESRLAAIDGAGPGAGPVQAAAAEPPVTVTPASQASALNPAISLILAGNYTSLSEDPETWAIAGFMPNGGEVGPGERSFNLGESELVLSASVDPYFRASLTAAVTGEDEIEVEEAFFQTLSLPAGLTAKGGRFFSGIGYLNEVHAHAWDFVDQPLVYQALFANQMEQDGVQLKWLAPTDLFVELGAEVGSGGAFPATRRNRNGASGTTLFAHVGGDIGDSMSWRAGASWMDLRAEGRGYEDVDDDGAPVLNAFTGNSRTWGVDAVLKWSPYGSVTRRQLKLQGEYFRRKETGELAFDLDGLALADAYRSEQSGWYVQGVYQFLPRWRAGIRYDSLDSGTPEIGLVDSGALPPEAFPSLLPANPDRIAAMLDWNPSEFSRLRVQYAWDDARDGGDRDRQLFLQYLYGIGAHGAHKY
ncbi:MAG: hypothetical protein ACT4UP_03175 [Gammaproteobacteria bacterium]